MKQKIVVISDTHCQLNKIDIPEGDILIHAGDFTYRRTIPEIAQFNYHLEAIKHKFQKIVLVAGNHDWLFETNQNVAKKLLNPSFLYLENSYVEVLGLKIWGSPFSNKFFNWAFMRERGFPMRQIWKEIPEGLDILITHGPPYGILDKVEEKEHVGCEELASAVQKLKIPLCISGHIHSSYGVVNKEWDTEKSTLFVNASSCDEAYKPVNKPIVINFDSETRKASLSSDNL